MVRYPIIVALPLVLLAACSPSYSPNDYSSTAVQQANKVEQGVIVGVRPVGVTAAGTTGAVAGAAAGGIVGAAAPAGNVGTAFTTLGGTLIGGLVGTGVERATGDTTAFEYVVRKPNGELVSVTQKDQKPLELGQRVLVIAGNQARIVPDYTVGNEPPKPIQPNPSASPAPAVAPTPVPGAAPVAGGGPVKLDSLPPPAARPEP